MEEEEKKRAKKRLAVRIISPEDQHPRIIQYFWRNQGEPDRMISMKNSVYKEVFGDTAGGRLLRLNNVEWRRGEKLRMQMIPARMSLDSIVQYVSVELKLSSKYEAHIKDRHGNGNRERRDDQNHRAIQEDPTVGGDRSQDPGSEDGRTSSGGEYMTPDDHEDAHFFAFGAHNTKVYGHDKGKWRKAPPRQGREPRRIGNPPLSVTAYRREHAGCWVCYGKVRSHKHDHKTCKVYEEDKRAYFQAHPEKVPNEKQIDELKKGQADGGRHAGSSHGGDRRTRQIDEVAESLLKATEDLKNLQERMGSQGPGDSQHDGAAVNCNGIATGSAGVHALNIARSDYRSRIARTAHFAMFE